MIKNQKGFTLVEVMVVVALIGILMISVQSMLNYGIFNYRDNTNYYLYKLQARYAMNKVIHEIKTNNGAKLESGMIKNSDSSVVLVNPTKTDTTEEGNLFFYFEPNKFGTGDGYGELRGQNGRVIAKYIKDFTIEDESAIDLGGKLVKITIKGGKENSKRIFTLSTYVQLY